ncbi:hypothetical protein [Robiginitalea aurantiaca]|uniref:Uncharacterized protein n=1 Tax=Robiginitalea aurantiaca TaxID=3056915 RepID=A0ABT7WHB2_9FLAO|nr:hypothetical protein [Robiginitalea aurantiaca]MDM9632199.1 hypothetical protein [Robiginitalea aurantiaca]
MSSKGLAHPEHPLLLVLRKLFLFTLLLSLLWGPVMFLLSGNFAGNFENKEAFRGSQRASKVYWTLNYALALLPVGLWFLQAVFTFFWRKAPGSGKK